MQNLYCWAHTFVTPGNSAAGTLYNTPVNFNLNSPYASIRSIVIANSKKSTNTTFMTLITVTE